MSAVYFVARALDHDRRTELTVFMETPYMVVFVIRAVVVIGNLQVKAEHDVANLDLSSLALKSVSEWPGRVAGVVHVDERNGGRAYDPLAHVRAYTKPKAAPGGPVIADTPVAAVDRRHTGPRAQPARSV